MQTMQTKRFIVINKILDLEKDLRLSESCHAACATHGIPRNMNRCRDEGWFLLMEREGFFVDGKFLSIIDILHKTEGMSLIKRTVTLEAVGCDLSLLIKDGY